MIDFHMHVLPAMDDGSKDVSTSIAMLERSIGQGICIVAATPHFYAQENSPSQFLERRQRAYDTLIGALGREEWEPPQLLLGAEVHFFNGMSAVEELDDLCLEGTNLLLLEMPFAGWTERMLREVDDIIGRGIEPVAAHIERYMGIQSSKVLERFLSKEILVQSNAGFFLSKKTERKALQMLKNQRIHYLGSDAHNLTSRPPNLGDAQYVINRKLGDETMCHLEYYESLVVQDRSGGVCR